MGSDSSIRKRWLVIGFFVALWTAIACLSAVEAYIGQLHFDKPISWELAFRRAFKDWYTYGVLSIGVIWFCRRNRLEHGLVLPWVVKHFGGALIFSAAYIIGISWLLTGERSVQTGQILTFDYLVKKFAIHYCIMTLIMYWLMVFAHSGWHYYQRFREREMQTSELRRQLTEARLEALRMQLNPHFLFNTLHAISALIHANPEAADRVVARLSELLRLSLDQSKPQEVPLSEEIGFLDRYLEIEQTRFADRLQVEKEIEPDTADALVPYLILQPLVENAIRHGIEPREEQGKLGIRARRNNGTLELRVTDNGNGLHDQDPASIQEGIGLSNTRSRLRHLYGENCRFQLVNAAGGGLEARIEIPFHTTSEGNATT